MNEVYGPTNFSMLNTDHFAKDVNQTELDDDPVKDQILREADTARPQTDPAGEEGRLDFQRKWLTLLYGDSARVTLRDRTICIEIINDEHLDVFGHQIVNLIKDGSLPSGLVK